MLAFNLKLAFSHKSHYRNMQTKWRSSTMSAANTLPKVENKSITSLDCFQILNSISLFISTAQNTGFKTQQEIRPWFYRCTLFIQSLFLNKQRKNKKKRLCKPHSSAHNGESRHFSLADYFEFCTSALSVAEYDRNAAGNKSLKMWSARWKVITIYLEGGHNCAK